jgi:hypothetical protein
LVACHNHVQQTHNATHTQIAANLHVVGCKHGATKGEME